MWRLRLKNPPKTPQQVRESALGLLARREHSRRELMLKLRSRGCSDEVINLTLNELVDEEFQSDERFAEFFVRARFNRGSGPLRIRAELLTRGLEDDLIETSIAVYVDQWKEQACKVYQKRYLNDLLDKDDFKERVKRSAFLQSRGFTSDQIRYAIESSEAI